MEEHAETVGGGDRCRPVKDDDAARFARHTGETDSGSDLQGGHAQDGQVHAALLSGLRAFDQYATRAVGRASDRFGQVADAAQHGVRAFLGLDGEDEGVGDDDGLADVVGAKRGGDPHGERDVGVGGEVGSVAAGGTGLEEKVGGDLVGAPDVETFGLELVEEVAQEGVVAVAGGGDGAGEGLEAAEIGLEGREVGAGDLAGHADGVATGAAQGFEAPAELGDADVGAVEGLEGGVGEAAQANNEGGVAGGSAKGGQLDGEGAAAGDEAQAGGSHQNHEDTKVTKALVTFVSSW